MVNNNYYIKTLLINILIFRQTQPIIDMCCSPTCIRTSILTVGFASLILTTLLVAVSLPVINFLSSFTFPLSLFSTLFSVYLSTLK